MNSNTLKKYQTLLKKLQAKQDVIKGELTDCQQRYNSIKNEVLDVKTRISELSKNNELVISEHATLRILERMFDINFDEIHKQVIEEIAPHYEKLGDGIFPVKCLNLRAVIKNGVIVTVK